MFEAVGSESKRILYSKTGRKELLSYFQFLKTFIRVSEMCRNLIGFGFGYPGKLPKIRQSEGRNFVEY